MLAGNSPKPRNETIDILFGLLCIAIVFLHSQNIGFSINTFGTESQWFIQLLSLIYHTFVPMFFIICGYLSFNSFFSSEDNWAFFRRKIVHFLPIYITFLAFSVLRNIEFWDGLSSWQILLGFLGLYWEPGITHGQIMFVVNMTILTRIIFNVCNFKREWLVFYLIGLAVAANFLIERPAEFYMLKYLGYYLAFIFGMWLKTLKVFDEGAKLEFPTIMTFSAVALIVPILNYNKIYILEINYQPNSIEQIVFSGTLLVFSYLGLKNFSCFIPERLKYVFINIGKNSFAHYIIHNHVIFCFIYFGTIFHVNQVLVQLIIIGTASIVSVFIVYPIWKKLFSFFDKAGEPRVEMPS